MSGIAASPLSLFRRFVPFPDAQRSRDPLAFPGYRAKLDEALARTGASESVTSGLADWRDVQAVAIVFNFAFLGGSMGEATGQCIVSTIDRAIELRLPLVTVAASGGARMQEGMLSLVQMHSVSKALSRMRRAGLPHVAVACNPTTGGVWVALVSAADVILAERGAELAFAGTRVRSTTEDDFEFRAEGKFAAGAIDAIVSRESLPLTLERYVRALKAAMASACDRCPAPDELPAAVPTGNGWAAVESARHPRRPRAADYLDSWFDERVAISGDRVSGCDEGMLCGIGLRGKDAVAYAAQTGSANTAAGYRTAARLISFAETLRIPVVTMIDTPGAESSATAERAGIGTAIGQLLQAITEATVPITSLLIGEGGSGGALALAASDGLWAASTSYFSVIAPESAATILYRDPTRAKEAADAMKVDSAALIAYGLAKQMRRPNRKRTHRSNQIETKPAEQGQFSATLIARATLSPSDDAVGSLRIDRWPRRSTKR